MMFQFIAFATFAFLLKDVNSLEDKLCFNCDPSDPGKCLNPTIVNTNSEKCSESSLAFNVTGVKKQIADFETQDINTRIGLDEELVYECYSFYYDPGTEGNSNTGMYRGCVKINKEVLDSCTLIIEQTTGTVTNCKSCRQEDNCNVGGGAAGIHFSMTILIINLLICLYIFEFK